MKRTVLALTALFVSLFVIVTLLKDGSPDEATPFESQSLDAGDRDRIRRFWQSYRSATRHRTAGEIRQAALEYQRALELDATHEDALYYLGSMHFELGEFAKAEGAWQRLTRVDPTGSRGFSRLGDLYFCFEQDRFFDPDRAQEMFERALGINSEETGPLLRLGQIALVKGETSASMEYLEAVTATNFRSVAAYFFKGFLAWRDGDEHQAEQLFRLAAKHYEPAEPVQGVLSEGDTRSGKAILAKVGQCQSFHAHAADLPSPDDPQLRSLMNERYRQLDLFLRNVR